MTALLSHSFIPQFLQKNPKIPQNPRYFPKHFWNPQPGRDKFPWDENTGPAGSWLVASRDERTVKFCDPDPVHIFQKSVEDQPQVEVPNIFSNVRSESKWSSKYLKGCGNRYACGSCNLKTYSYATCDVAVTHNKSAVGVVNEVNVKDKP